MNSSGRLAGRARKVLLVRILAYWDTSVLLGQCPGKEGIWNGIRFTVEPVEDCDYLVLISYPTNATTVNCPPGNIWVLLQEPPTPELTLPRGTRRYPRVFTPDPGLRGPPFVLSQPALPWQVKRGYDYLVSCAAPDKPKLLSWVTSNVTSLDGHRSRMRFLERLRGRLEFDLFGRGFAPVNDKWDALAPYRYSLAVENFRGSYYWTEKLIDCFLSWTMPIYCGCPRIAEYFPAESMVQIETEDPDAVEKVREAVASDRWKRNRDAIAYARELVLNKYQLFPFLANEIVAHEARDGERPAVRRTLAPQKGYGRTWQSSLGRLALRWKERIKRHL